MAALQSRGIPVELIRLPDEGHGISSLASQLRVYPAIADFLWRHLLEDADAGPTARLP